MVFKGVMAHRICHVNQDKGMVQFILSPFSACSVIGKSSGINQQFYLSNNHILAIVFRFFRFRKKYDPFIGDD